ncbi:hypothetical protein, partial [Paraburkholderia caledonica]|uniref:hypothetical protein n=1 Tax=Paraburkholderia caledonica TaxID=134536 RepID=UPI001C4EBDFC
ASGVWDGLMKDARRRMYEKEVLTDHQPASAREEMSADNDAGQDQPAGSFENLLCRIEETDGPELVMCKLMGNLMWNDLRAIVKRRNFVEDGRPDLSVSRTAIKTNCASMTRCSGSTRFRMRVRVK